MPRRNRKGSMPGLTPLPPMTRAEKRGQARTDFYVLREAEKVKADRARLAAAKRVAQEEVKALRKV